MLFTSEHYELIEQFEKVFSVRGTRADKEEKDVWGRGHIFCHPQVNELFLAYRHGYVYGKSRFQNAESAAPSAGGKGE